MPISNSRMKDNFQTGDTPVQSQFHDLIDSIGGFPTIADLLADTAQSWAVGEIIRAGGHRYQVATSGATDHHLTTAGGVKLYVMPGADGKRSVDAFGAVGDGITDDTAGLSAALNAGGFLSLTTGRTYLGDGQDYAVTTGFALDGNGAEIRNWPIAGDASGISGMHFHNVRFGSTAVAGVAPPRATDFRNADVVSYDRCTFDNTAFNARADDNSPHAGLSVTNCIFNADWTNFTYDQKDLITVRGYHGVNIHGNTIKARNIHRLFKLSSNTGIPDYSLVTSGNTAGVFITNNTIDVLCDANPSPGKQLIDTFFGTTQFVFANNHVKAYGLTSGIDGKTAAPYADANVATSQKIINNYFEMDAVCINLQAAFGVVPYTQNSYDNLLVTGNTFMPVNTTDDTVAIRYFNSVIVRDNQFISDDDTMARNHVYCASSDVINISDNTLQNGIIRFVTTTSNGSGTAFDSTSRQVIASGNTITGFIYHAAIMFHYCAGLESVAITGNNVTTPSSASEIYGSICLHNCTVTKLVCTGNVSNHVNDHGEERLRQISVTATDVIEANNSWQAA